MGLEAKVRTIIIIISLICEASNFQLRLQLHQPESHLLASLCNFYTQTFQNPLIKEYTLDHIRDPTKFQVYSLTKGFWKVRVGFLNFTY